MKVAIPLMVLAGLCGAATCSAQEKNKRAQQAEKAYEAAIEQARAAYIAELETAIKEEGGEGHLDEANRLSEVKEALELEAKLGSSDPADVARSKLENSTWKTPRNPRGYIRFLKNNKTTNHLRVGGAWITFDGKTAITQSFNSGAIYLFEFDDELKNASEFTGQLAKATDELTLPAGKRS